MNVAALILALIGAALSLFQDFILVPFLGEISLDNIWGLILSHLSETGNLISETWSGLSGIGEKIVFIFIFLLLLGFLLTPISAVWQGFRAFLRKEKDDDKPWQRLLALAVLCVIASGVLYFSAEAIIKAMSEKMGESEMLVGAILPAHSMFLAYVPLIWAVCFGIASACAYTDEQNIKARQEQLDKMNEILAGQKQQSAASYEITE